jgi:hypothetical protein
MDGATDCSNSVLELNFATINGFVEPSCRTKLLKSLYLLFSMLLSHLLIFFFQWMFISESGVGVAGEVCLPYLCAGLGMVGAGIVLHRYHQTWFNCSHWAGKKKRILSLKPVFSRLSEPLNLNMLILINSSNR